MVTNIIYMKKVLLTGASGFLGGAISNKIINSGKFELHAIVRNKKKVCRFNLENFSKKSFVYNVDLVDFNQTYELIKCVKPDYIIHTAALANVNEAVRAPITAFENSAISYLNILECIRLNKINTKIINHSSDKVYNNNIPPYVELMDLKPNHIYDVGKVTQEYLGNSYYLHYGVKTVNIRSGNYYGHYDFDFNRLIPYICKCIVQNKEIILRSSKNFSRDFLYIEEAASVNLKFLEMFELNNFDSFGESFNFSQEKAYSIESIIKNFEILENKSLNAVYENNQMFESEELLLDCNKSKKVLSWENSTDFEKGLKQTLEFYKKYF